MITASGGSTPMLWEASLAWARVASLTMGAAAAAKAAARRNERRGIRETSELESVTGNYPPRIAAAGGSASARGSTQGMVGQAPPIATRIGPADERRCTGA